MLCSDAEAAAAMMASSEAMQGLWEAELVLYHPHSFPQKAIAPVKVHWQSITLLCSYYWLLACWDLKLLEVWGCLTV